MKLSKFKKDQVSVSSLKSIKGANADVMTSFNEGTSHTLRHSTSCTGSDHDAGRHDSD